MVIEEIDDYIARAIRSRDLPPILEDAVCYTVLAGGKRLRPALMLMCCEAVGGDRADALAPATAIELIHNFSLVHDDLPAMDDDDLRRGRATLHVEAGEAMAILGGDAMMSLAFELLVEAPVDSRSKVRLTSELAAAVTAMINGQIYDTIGGMPDNLSDEQRLRLIHRNKTGALLRAACRMGAICGGAADETLDMLTRYGEAVGLMFQITDDLLDVTQSAEHVGKATGKDLQAGKLTYPGVMGIERTRADIHRLRLEACQAIEGLGRAARPLCDLSDDMARRTR